MRIDIRTMPASVQRHNLARLREALRLTQSDLADLIMRSLPTIKAIETGKLPLSENLATLISEVTGVDRLWLLENNLEAPVPPLRPLSATWAPEDRAYQFLCSLLMDLFSRLFAVCRRLQQGDGRKGLATYIKEELQVLEETGYEPDAIQSCRATVEPFEFFQMHPELLDYNLGRLINLDFLIKDAYQAQMLGQKAFRKASESVKKKKKQSNFVSHDVVFSAPTKPVSETRSPRRRKGPRPSRKSP
jgi:transcriptional regulator with XRE-family HTH domain